MEFLKTLTTFTKIVKHPLNPKIRKLSCPPAHYHFFPSPSIAAVLTTITTTTSTTTTATTTA
ncbi:hypothetical protein E2C01_078215 [Portunus trituberculatus]|uniref:Uncharacterized protein n=1 Tax=Portunus trituberculatus TaxID=210409 RepID=A0A5B7IM21_PORTR|nr:hypothetical protein [Portunus trituberculatus]